MNQISILRNYLIMAVAAILLSTPMMAKDSFATAKIKTNPHCADCKVKIEKALNDIDGVKQAKLNMEDKVVTVKYNKATTTKDALSKAILDLGFTADNVEPANAHENCGAGEAKSCDLKAKNTKAGGCCSTKAKVETKTTENTGK